MWSMWSARPSSTRSWAPLNSAPLNSARWSARRSAGRCGSERSAEPAEAPAGRVPLWSRLGPGRSGEPGGSPGPGVGGGGLRTCGWPALRWVCLPANEHRRGGDDHEDTDDARADYRPAGVGVDPLLGRWVWAFVHRVDPSVGAVGFTSAPPGAWSSTTKIGRA